MVPYGFSIFCDDIRFEKNETFSLIGCYGPEMFIFQPLPVTLPKLGILIHARMPIERHPEQNIIIYTPDSREPFFTYKIEAEITEFKPSMAPPEAEARDLDQQRGFICPLLFSPFVIEKEGYIRVRLLYGSERIRMGALKVTYKPAPNVALPRT